jgi:hypothetical protein
LPEQTEGDECDDAEQGEGERFREIGETEDEAHESSVTKMAGREMSEQGGKGEEEKCLEKCVGANLAMLSSREWTRARPR